LNRGYGNPPVVAAKRESLSPSVGGEDQFEGYDQGNLIILKDIQHDILLEYPTFRGDILQ
jgi:hypothetical protein